MTDRPFIILVKKGGGVRGAGQPHLLSRLEDACPGLVDRIDLFAGTSIGGINALGLANRLKPADLVRMFIDRSGEIFEPRFLHQIRPGAKYPADGLRRVLSDVFGPLELRDLSRRVLVSSYDCVKGDAKFWHNWGPNSDSSARCVDVAMRTSAAPTYFPPANNRYIDGGVAANDPVVCAIAKALKEGVRLEQIRVLSIGTGRPKDRGFHPGDWGPLRWLPNLVGVFLGAPMSVAKYQAERLPGVQYFDLDFDLPEDIPLDAADRVMEIVELAELADIRPAVRWVREWVLPESPLALDDELPWPAIHGA